MNALFDEVARIGVLPVVVLDSPEQAAPLAEALIAGGLPAAEVTFRTDAAAAGLRAMAAYPELLLAAGTVRTPAQVDQALEAGARMIVSPGLSEAVVRAAHDAGAPIVPGVATASEVLRAGELGLDVVKFFPAQTSGGAPAVKALAAPFADMRFIPTGGISTENLASYAALPAVLAVGGSWMVERALLTAGDWATVTQRARDAVSAVGAARPSAVLPR